MHAITPLSFFNPWMLWFELAMKSGEMMFASGQVIDNRLRRIARTGHNPGAGDRAEFMRMGTEKLQATGESMMAVTQLMMRMWQPWMAGRGSLPRLSRDTARLAGAALQPVHRAATANARRLARTKRR
jgi:hypothetical protein